MKRQTSLKLMTGVLAFIVLGFVTVAMACKDEPEPLLCKCEVKDHLGVGETCCKAEDCECGLQVYGNIVDYKGNEIPIYRKGKVRDMVEEVNKVQKAYDGEDKYTLSEIRKSALLNKFIAVYITSGDKFKYILRDGKYIIEMGEDLAWQSMYYIIYELAGDILNGLAKTKQLNNAKLVIMSFNASQKIAIIA